MTGGRSTRIVIKPDEEPDAVWAAVLAATTTAGIDGLSAARVTVAATELVGRAPRPAVVELVLVETDDRVEATICGGVGQCANLPAGLTETCSQRIAGTGEIQHVLTVRVGPPLPDAAQAPLSDVAATGHHPRTLLAAALVALEQQSRRLARCQAQAHQFQEELDETNQGLLAIYAELETANRRIADLVAMLSHDIRQPLGIITLSGTLLLQQWNDLDEAERHRDLTRIVTAGTRMTQLVEEILTLTQIDTTDLPTRAAPVEVHTVAAEAIASVCDASADTVVINGGPDCWVLADPRHLNQILTNLVSNALKYGAPPVEITATPAADGVDISVRDHGDGVPAEFVPHLFGRFARADTPTSRTKKGTGLGLYIVRQLAEANRGTIAYADHPAGGGCFTVRLPMTEPAPPSPSG
jgi:signal transduction histidine kinase